MKSKSHFKLSPVFVVSVLFFLLNGISGFAFGKRDVNKTERAVSVGSDQSRILAAYILDDTASSANPTSAKLYLEGFYVPQATAAYFPTDFSITEKERRLAFDTNLAYRVMAKASLGNGVLVYTVETTGFDNKMAAGKRYTIAFALKSLGTEAGSAVQPAPYALERAARMSGLKSGKVRLESVQYDEASKLFKALVVVSPNR
ncbi:hypothetical protein MASR2M78_23550 [Treponema sp.]